MTTTNAHWARVTELFHAAVARPASEREALLSEECADDTALHREVRSLLTAHQTGAIVPGVTSLATGTRLGDYEVTSFLAAGAMGEVYRGRDTKLGRDVALKILRPLFVRDANRRRWFQREARTLASLNHPNIATIYGFIEADAISALVLELVEGDTLAQRITQGKLPIAEALRIGKQIALALEAAHERGIIHRDLKPANIKLRRDGSVKVLDFGLAKSGATGVAELTPASDAAIAASGAHVVVGTPAYMSPEQARGEQTDKRTDIWAFGCVMFEMLSGNATFADKTVADTIARVIDGVPEWTSLPSATPSSVRRLLARTLVKDVRRRLNDIGDARLEIESADADDDAPVRRGASSRHQPRDWSSHDLSVHIFDSSPRTSTRQIGLLVGALMATVMMLSLVILYLTVRSG